MSVAKPAMALQDGVGGHQGRVEPAVHFAQALGGREPDMGPAPRARLERDEMELLDLQLLRQNETRIAGMPIMVDTLPPVLDIPPVPGKLAQLARHAVDVGGFVVAGFVLYTYGPTVYVAYITVYGTYRIVPFVTSRALQLPRVRVVTNWVTGPTKSGAFVRMLLSMYNTFHANAAWYISPKDRNASVFAQNVVQAWNKLHNKEISVGTFLKDGLIRNVAGFLCEGLLAVTPLLVRAALPHARVGAMWQAATAVGQVAGPIIGNLLTQAAGEVASIVVAGWSSSILSSAYTFVHLKFLAAVRACRSWYWGRRKPLLAACDGRKLASASLRSL